MLCMCECVCFYSSLKKKKSRVQEINIKITTPNTLGRLSLCDAQYFITIIIVLGRVDMVVGRSIGCNNTFYRRTVVLKGKEIGVKTNKCLRNRYVREILKK